MNQTADIRHQTRDRKQRTGGRSAVSDPGLRSEVSGLRSQVSCLMSRPRGFTLVEVMIVALLFLVVGGALLTTFLTGRTSYLSSDAFVLVQQEARRAFDVMVRELREASASGGCAANATNGGLQLNFQVAQGYNQAGCPNTACCPSGNCANAICWGSEVAGNPWIHYALVDGDGNAATGNDRQLVRSLNKNAERNNVSAAACRVLAN